jgi:hypothetical protein
MQIIELLKENMDLIAFIFVTPEIIGRDKLQQYVNEIKDIIDFPQFSNLFNLTTGVIMFFGMTTLIWLPLSAYLTAKIVTTFYKLGYNIPWLLSGAALVTEVLLFVVIALIGFSLTSGIVIAMAAYALKQGVSRLFLTIGLVTFLVARVLGVANALIATGE